MISNLDLIRNIGISAHIDSGKTTLTERILFYTGRIHAIHEVKGKDGVGATMDSMDLERERGITIQSAATHCFWSGFDKSRTEHFINIIDTPGHVDFTIEVERALRVLDGAILVLCAVAGVQSQSLTVDRQMRRYNVPRLAFINKCDRQGANPYRVRQQLKEKLGHNAVMLHLPIGLEEKHAGHIDLVEMKAYFYRGEQGEDISIEDIPADLADEARTYREELLDNVSMFSDELTEQILEENVQPATLKDAIRKATIALKLVPVFVGSAYKNKGVQKLLDGVIDYLPNPREVVNEAIDLKAKEESKIVIPSNPTGPLLALAFKLEDGRYGQLTYVRIYQGTLKKGDFIVNARSGNKIKVGRLVRMHSNEMQDIEDCCAGDIVALFGVDCFSGDTFHDGTLDVAMSSMHVPAAVIDLTIKPKTQAGASNMGKAVRRFSKEDPTFRVSSDPETGETIISGMGELHLEVYVERMKREYGCEVITSPPRVAYRETISQHADFNYTHKKQTGGSGQYGRVAGFMDPLDGGQQYEFVDDVVGGSIPREFISSCDKGFRKMLEKGELIGAPVVGVRCTINDGSSHAVDSSDIAFQLAAMGAWRESYGRAKPVVLEPIMKVGIEGPAEFHGSMVGTIMQRRGIIIGSAESEGFSQLEAEVPLAEMFGYSTTLRSATQGKAEFTMEFARYSVAPQSVTDELVKKYQQEKKEK